MNKVPDHLCILLDELNEYHGQKVELTNSSILFAQTKRKYVSRVAPTLHFLMHLRVCHVQDTQT